jgi:hypothetical protein
MKIPIAILWGIVQLKTSLFWLYLWQLKNYHTGRFIDHFRTKKGKSIFINPLYLLKILFLFIPFLGLALIAFEGIYNILKGKFIKPVFTKKNNILILLYHISFCYSFLEIQRLVF